MVGKLAALVEVSKIVGYDHFKIWYRSWRRWMAKCAQLFAFRRSRVFGTLRLACGKVNARRRESIMALQFPLAKKTLSYLARWTHAIPSYRRIARESILVAGRHPFGAGNAGRRKGNAAALRFGKAHEYWSRREIKRA